MAEKTIGVIKEQGDMGLFFDPVTPEEQTILESANKKETDDKDDKR